MRGPDSTQFGIKIETKNKLDRFKAQQKEAIILKYKKKRRIVTNDDAINFLLEKAGMR